ncbi:amidase [Halorubrum vacuolatum]|uniref:Asp-tRNAAsn/Glu-tRNAGln amidotransferase A subunit n=1 Tax=Halorubrum vacuolatum TaxID=63740 RepID=A0A238WU92_HALVU|nr:amidase [Halorubrum vacuolatum]SNR49998.1 Asp-tRNAAsn/Glu-tRNAGln amidotransferase A subunit [Halorubrum vacuolatum]
MTNDADGNDVPAGDDGFDPVEATIGEIHGAFAAGTLTATALVETTLDRIDRYDADLAAYIHVNEHARDRARDLDDRYAESGLTGPLHGIPVAVKDNHDTADMPTSVGSAALAEVVPPRDATVISRLRDAGAIVIGKTNLQELSFGTDTISSARGATRNPYDTDRRPSGSSGGTAVAVAATLATVGTGTDTCSSVRSPPAFTNLVGVRPTMGLVSRTGIAPLSLTQDTAGPIARTVTDAARTLEAMVGYDPEDPLTARGVGNVPERGYAAALDPDALDGARIGVVRKWFEPTDPGNVPKGAAEGIAETLDAALEAMADAGATLVDPVDVVDDDELDAARVVGFEFMRDVDRYLDELGETTPVDSLEALVETGTMADSIERRIRDGGILSVDVDGLDTDPDYLRALALRERLRTETIDRLVRDDLDAVVYPPATVPPVRIPDLQPFEEMRCQLSAHTGLPAVVVQAGFTDDGLPVGIELLGRPFDERRLLALAFAYEAKTDHRRPPDAFS